MVSTIMVLVLHHNGPFILLEQHKNGSSVVDSDQRCHSILAFLSKNGLGLGFHNASTLAAFAWFRPSLAGANITGVRWEHS